MHIYKSGCKMEPLNYRPVSLTSILCKICEEVIKERWVAHLEEENVFMKGNLALEKVNRVYPTCYAFIQEL